MPTTDAVPTPDTARRAAPRVADRPIPRRRLVLLALGGICLLAGLDAALLLAGLPAPITADRLEQAHGPLMMLGFLGTLIALERAIAVRAAWALLSPALLAVGGLLLLTPLPAPVGFLAQAVGAALLVAIYAVVWQRAGSAALLIQWLGSLLAVAAALLWAAGLATGILLPFLAGFLVLTIGGERLELARIAGPGRRAEETFLLLACATVIAAVVALLWPTPGAALFGLVLLLVAAWLARYDVAVRMVRAEGLPRYVAVNLLAGLGWLIVAGLTWVLLGSQVEGPGYDLVVHAIGLGFGMSMVLAHAPIILPAVLLRPLPYRPVLYASTVLLQGSLLLRAAGDLRELPALWQAGSAFNVLALLVFLVTAVTLVVRR